MREYRERDADNSRWEGFEFRPGDIVIDAPSKSGTTWTQLLVALLVFDGPEFPEPVGQMSFWMEQCTRPIDEAHRVFAEQTHRRFIKSHTPLDGVPLRDDVRYVCVGRDPRDAAISMMHHGENMNRERFAELVGVDPDATPERLVPMSTTERIEKWLEGGDFPEWSVRFLAHHYQTFWDARTADNVALFHFADYKRDLPGEIMRLAAHLDIELSIERARQLADEASIERARARAADIAPEAHMGLWKDTSQFFRSGASGEGAASMTEGQLVRYSSLLEELVPSDLATWMHHGRG